MTTPNTDNLSPAQEAEMTEVLAGLDGLDELETVAEPVEEIIEEPVIEETVEAVSENAVLAEDELDELDMAIDKAESYATQESTAIGASETGEIQSKGTVTPKTKRASAPRTPRDLNAVPAEHFVLTGDVSVMSDEDKAAAKTAAMSAVPGQKKVAEKFENLFQSMAAGRAPSKYIMTAFGALDKDGSVTTAELVGAFKASGVGEGTARSQSGQMMALFPAIGLAERDGKTLKLKADSNVAAYLRKHVAT